MSSSAIPADSNQGTDLRLLTKAVVGRPLSMASLIELVEAVELDHVLVDVRELPISRKRGFAKTALSEALERVGVEYLHLKSLGNPKEFRDLYKSGDVEGGRSKYERFLLAERLEALASLDALLHEKRSALMCVETDQSVCHRDVILDALRSRRNLDLKVAQLD